MAALPQSLSGDLLRIAGGANIAENEPALEKFPQYAQINAEKVIEADPDLILLMTHSNPEDVKAGFMSEMKQNAAWHDVSAVKMDTLRFCQVTYLGQIQAQKSSERSMN